MSGPGKEDERPKLERFDGSQPSFYRRWRRKAELMLLALPNTYTKDRWGAKLLEYISGEAKEPREHVPLSDLVKEKGHELIFKALDERYKELDKEVLHNHLNAYFYDTSIRSGETFRNMTVRLDSAYRRLQEHSVELPSEVRGWFLLRKLQLDQSSEAEVLTHTKGSSKYEDVNKAIQSIFPQGSAKSGAKVKEVYEAEVVSTVNEDESEETIDEVFQAVADQVQAAEEYDDEDALEVFETYKEVRKRMQDKNMGRGYRKEPKQSWSLTGTVKGKIETLKSRTRCHLCEEKGHWKRECPKRASSSSSGQRPPRGGAQNDAMVAEGSGSGPDHLGGEYFIDPSSESAQGWARHHSENNPTRPIPAEGSPASSRIRTAPQRERSDTPDPRRGFAGALKDSHGTTVRALRHARSPQRVRRRAQGFARHHSESAPTRPIPVERSSASSRIRTARHRSPQRVRRRAIRHARSPQRVRRRAQGFARHHSESTPTRPIPAEGSPASSRIRTAPQRERSDTPDPRRGFIGELKDSQGTTARAIRHARSL